MQSPSQSFPSQSFQSSKWWIGYVIAALCLIALIVVIVVMKTKSNPNSTQCNPEICPSPLACDDGVCKPSSSPSITCNTENCLYPLQCKDGVCTNTSPCNATVCPYPLKCSDDKSVCKASSSPSINAISSLTPYNLEAVLGSSYRYVWSMGSFMGVSSYSPTQITILTSTSSSNTKANIQFNDTIYFQVKVGTMLKYAQVSSSQSDKIIVTTDASKASPFTLVNPFNSKDASTIAINQLVEVHSSGKDPFGVRMTDPQTPQALMPTQNGPSFLTSWMFTVPSSSTWF